MAVEEVKYEAANDEKFEGETSQDDKKSIETKELTEEDRKLEEELNAVVQRLTEGNQNFYRITLESLRTIIRASTTSITTVPKTLKFMRTHYLTLIEIYKKIIDQDVKKLCADIISVLAMTSALEHSRECLHYRLSSFKEAIRSWGHEYVRHLTAEIAQEWNVFDKSDPNFKLKKEKLLNLVHEIVPYHMKHNAEAEACDLLMEIERLDLLSQYVDSENQSRVCLYLTSCVPYLSDDEKQKVLKVATEIYEKFGKMNEALRCSIMMSYTAEIHRMSTCESVPVTLTSAPSLALTSPILAPPLLAEDYATQIRHLSDLAARRSKYSGEEGGKTTIRYSAGVIARRYLSELREICNRDPQLRPVLPLLLTDKHFLDAAEFNDRKRRKILQ